MRKLARASGPVCGLLLLAGALGCQTIEPPPVDQVKAVQLLEQPDPRTLEIFGDVSVQRTVAPEDYARAEQMTLERLKEAALRSYPETTVLFGVAIRPGDDGNTLRASGIAARRRGT